MNKYVYSRDEEWFTSDEFDSFEECKAALLEEYPDGGYVGIVERIDPEKTFRYALAMVDIEEAVWEYLGDNEGEYAENFELSDDHKKSLNKCVEDAVVKWVRDNEYEFDFSRVEDVQDVQGQEEG